MDSTPDPQESNIEDIVWIVVPGYMSSNYRQD